jgi:uncharacterized protein (TIGR02757 family)
VIARDERLKDALEELVRRTDVPGRMAHDPIVFPRRFTNPVDIEITGWLAAGLAYGRVPLFQAALEKILAAMGGRPAHFLSRFNPAKDVEAFLPLYYRMNEGRDIACFLYIIGRIVERHGSVGALFESFYGEADPDIGPALERFVRHALSIDTSPIYGRSVHPPGLARFFALPSKGSSCKRQNLFLRWMVRPDDGLDFGLWKKIPPAKLIVPLDTHVLRISRYLGLTRRKSAGWATAKQITERLKRIDPVDPLRFDFPLCHHGISGGCPSAKAPERCRACSLLAECARGRMLARG